MRKWTGVIDLPVVAEDGVELERVRGLVMNPTHTHVSFLLMSSDIGTRKAHVLRIQDVRSFGDTDIRVPSPAAIVAVNLAPDIRLVLYPHGPMTRTRLHTHEGEPIGVVNDLLFEETTGHIDHFEIAKECESDEFCEQSKLPLHEELEHGVIAHASIIREQAEDEFEFAATAPEVTDTPFDLQSRP